MSTELHGLSERWYQAWLEKDAATVERLMAEDYLYVRIGVSLPERARYPRELCSIRLWFKSSQHEHARGG